MREHLTAARAYLIGAMPQEYTSTLKLAQEILPRIEPAEPRSRTAEFPRQQIQAPSSDPSSNVHDEANEK
jgi:hypothetical protein